MDPSAPFPTATFDVAAVDTFSAPPTHPPYDEMICSAITALKERDGSSKRAIEKYIEESFPGLGSAHPAQLAHHLNLLKNSGLVVMVKSNYKLGSDTNASSEPKRGRGRPPKPKPDPAQIVPAQVDQAQIVPAQVDAAQPEKRAPGRPRKSMALAVVSDLPKRSPGRPRKYSNGGSENAVGPGRPKIKRRPGRPSKAQSMPLIVPYSTADVPRPRGRPKLGQVVGAENGLVLKRGRGRPPKVGGGAFKPKSATGRSPGRPKKNATPPVSEAAVELKKKLEYFQSKVMQIVEVLKPQLSAQSSVSAVTAVQELEGIATLDIYAPLPVDAPIQVPVPVPVSVHQPGPQNQEPGY